MPLDRERLREVGLRGAVAELRHQRVLAAQRLLEETDLPVDTVAGHCGFASAVSLRPVFTARVGVAPREYRRAFRGRAEE